MILRIILAAALALSCGMARAQSFAVVRVSLSPDSEADDWGAGIRGRNFWATHVTLNELIAWAYGVSPRQIDHAPEWMSRERFDVNGQPDAVGAQPSGDEFRAMLKSALAERFAMRTHTVQKVMPVYVLTVSDGGIKLAAVTDAKASWGIHRGWLSIANMSFDAVAKVMQRTVFDRPVLDRTNLAGRYSFILKWRADETQFSQMQGLDVPVETGTADVDDIYTAARKQLGIRIEAKKEAASALMIDAVSRPSPN